METPTKPPRTRKTVPCGGKGTTQSATRRKCKLGNFLLVASIAKALSQTGETLNLDENSIPLSEDLVLQVLRRNTLEVSKKVNFFKWCSTRPNYKHSVTTYSQIFRTVGLYCQHQRHLSEEIRDLLTSMKHENIALDSSTLKLLLDAFIRSGKYDLALEILDYVENKLEIGMPTSCLITDLYNSVLVAFARKNKLDLALAIFSKLLDGGGFVPDAITCNELFVGLRKADKKSEFNQLFDKLRDKNLFPLDTWGYNICIHAFGCWGDLATSLSLFKEMKEKGLYSPDLCTYNSLIHVLCSVGKVKDALIVYEELKGSGHEPDAFTYRILIHGCSKSYRIYEASKIFNEMQYNGFRPDTVIYNSLLDGFLKARKIKDACQLFEKMTDDGTRASCYTYNILIDGLFRNGRAKAASALFSDLKKKGQFVDAITYSIVVLNICRDGQIDEALRLVEEMEARGFVVDLVTITALLIAFYKHGRWDWTERLMKHIRDGNLMPTVLKWKAAMEASMKNPQSKTKDFKPIFPSKGDFTDILNLLSSAASSIEPKPTPDTAQWSSSPYMDMLADKAKVNPVDFSSQLFSLSKGKRVQEKDDSFDIDMVNTYLSIFLSKGKLSLACKLFEIFTNMGVESTTYTYNSMMSSFVKKGYFKEAWGVFQEMGEKVCPADIATYNVIIQGLGKMGKADIAKAILDNLLKEGGYLDIVMYNTLINALGKVGRVEEANRLFEQMRASGINPDVVTYNTMIEVHSKTGRLKDAYKFLKMMLDAGCPPNHVTDTMLEFLEKEIEKLRYLKASIKNPIKDDFS